MKNIHLRFLTIIFTAILIPLLSACHEVPDYEDDPYGNFDALCDIVEERYCFFQEKNIDWQALCRQYRERLNDDTRQLELFSICSELLDELQDGHVNLKSYFDTSYYRKWWTDYPQDFDLRTLQQYYLKFDYLQTSGISYKKLTDDIGYMYYPSFNSGINDTSLDYILAILAKTKGLIIDIRDNGGGMLTNIDKIVSRLIDNEITGGYIRHKTGPAPDAFSDPYPIRYTPTSAGHIKYSGKIIVLTNRSCYSAANSFASVMKSLPGVRIVGARTGGGGGMPFSSELPNGWSIRFSACPITNANDESIEFGIPPSPGCEVHAPAEELVAGTDAILDFAINLFKKEFEVAD